VTECPNCGRQADEGANFCSYCGASLRSLAIDRMIQEARRAVDQNPNDASARFNLALACKLGGLDELALEELGRVADLQPDFGDAHYQMALLHVKAGRLEQAIASLRRALEVEPDHTRAQQLLVRLSRRET